jgi:hypothetical protein
MDGMYIQEWKCRACPSRCTVTNRSPEDMLEDKPKCPFNTNSCIAEFTIDSQKEIDDTLNIFG